MCLILVLLQISVPQEERRDYERMYNPYELKNLMKEIGWIDWERLINAIMPDSVTLMDNELIVINEVGFLKRLDNLLKKTPNEYVKCF